MKDFLSGNYQMQGSFKSFEPSLINRHWVLDDMEIISLLSKADKEIGRLDSFSNHIPNIDLYIQMHILKEATQSSRIEGTQTNIEEALLDKDEIEPGKKDDWEEVQNYIIAMNGAVQHLKELPISTRLIKMTHKILMQGVRGHHKLPGEFRTSQNWIGGATIDDAVFVPPAQHNISELMSDLEKFVNAEDLLLPDLLKIAIIHYQFETIHPFLDGNGRMGRLLITLYLVEKNILKKPVLYLSDFFERNKALYYDNLSGVRTKNDLKQWLKFFLVGIYETAKSGVSTFNEILNLKKEVETKIQASGKRGFQLMQIMDELFQHPFLNQERISKVTKVSKNTAYKLIAELEGMDIIREVTGMKRGKYYRFHAYIQLFKK
ncbi:MAG: Fic family protein [Saprospiraceae bacterium]